MTNSRRHQSLISQTLLRAASITAALMAALVSVLLSVHSAQAQSYVVLYRFKGSPTDGQQPNAGMVRDAAGNLYGTTAAGGAYGAGTVFKLDASGKETVLYHFTGGTDGANPRTGLALDAADNLYGTTTYGGDSTCIVYRSGCGTVFRLNSAGRLKVLHRFHGPEGAFPTGLISDAAGNLRGRPAPATGCWELPATSTRSGACSRTGRPPVRWLQSRHARTAPATGSPTAPAR